MVGGQFCEAMGQLIVLLSPTDATSPDETEATFRSAAVWFQQANRNAPDRLGLGSGARR